MSLTDTSPFTTYCFVCQADIPSVSAQDELYTNHLLSLFFELMCDEKEPKQYPENLAHFCLTCQNFLKDWGSVKEQISVLKRRADRIKVSLSAMLLSSLKINSDVSRLPADAIQLWQRLTDVKKLLRNRFDVIVLLQNTCVYPSSKISLLTTGIQNGPDMNFKVEEKLGAPDDFEMDTNLDENSLEDSDLMAQPCPPANIEVIRDSQPMNETDLEFTVGDSKKRSPEPAVNLRPRGTLKKSPLKVETLSDDDSESTDDDGEDPADDWMPDGSDSETKEIPQLSPVGAGKDPGPMKTASEERKPTKARRKDRVKSVVDEYKRVVEVSPNNFLYLGRYHLQKIKKKGYKCGTCGDVINSRNRRVALNHIRELHSSLTKTGSRSLVEVAPNVFHYKNLPVEKHGEDYICVSCGFSAPRVPKLLDHMRRLHRGECICEVCGMKLKNWVTLRNHRLQVHEKLRRKFKCKDCDSIYNSSRALFSHKQKVHMVDPEEKKIVCEFCGAKFYTRTTLRDHLFRHTGEREFSCRYCDKKFGSYQAKHIHENIHTSKKIYRCDICDMTFTQCYSVTRHKSVVHKVCPQKGVKRKKNDGDEPICEPSTAAEEDCVLESDSKTT